MYEYVLFLSNTYFKKKCRLFFCKNTLATKISSLGVHVYSIKNAASAAEEISQQVTTEVCFNDKETPEQNVLYIKLAQGYYYSEDQFSEKKKEIEHDLLFMISGLLGVSSISCISDDKKQVSLDVNATAVVEASEQKIVHHNQTKLSKNTSRDETYSNDGAKAFFTDTWEQLNSYFQLHMNKVHPIFYAYYCGSRNLRLFCYKRYAFWINTYNYTINTEYNHNKCTSVKSTLYQYGINLECASINNNSYKEEYRIEFYKRDELHFILMINENRKKDIFAQLRQDYVNDTNYMRRYYDPNWGGDELYIFKQVLEHCKAHGFWDEFKKWREQNPQNINDLRGKCHWFKSTIEVNTWLNIHIPGISIE